MFDWSNYLTLAELLHRRAARLAGGEACLRSSISRAYYACFHSAGNFAEDHKELTLSHTGADHGAVIKHFREDPDPNRRKFGDSLDRLRAWRKQADYEDNVPGLASLVQTSLLKAQDAMRILTSF